MRISQMEIPYLNANSIFVTSRREKKFDLLLKFAYFPEETAALRILDVIATVCNTDGSAQD